MTKRFLALVVVLAALGAGFYFYQDRGEDDAPGNRYRSEAVARGDIVASVAATGAVSPTTQVIVGSQLSGQVVEILVDYNSVVTAGQMMARLNRDTLLARRDGARADLAQARASAALSVAQGEKVQAEIQRALAQRRDLEAQLQRANALLADAEATLQRQTSLKSRGIATDVTLQNAQTQRASQQAARLSAEAQIASSLAQVSSLEADAKVVKAQQASAQAQVEKAEAVVRQIEVDLANSEIRSPVDGVVVQRNVELGQTVAASLQAPTLFLVAEDLRKVVINVNLDEADVGRVREGQRVEFTVTAFPDRNFIGTVRQVRLGSQNVQNVVIYTTVVDVENPDLALLPGMTANLRIFTEQKRDVLRVANAALRWQPPAAQRDPATSGPASGAGLANPFANAGSGSGGESGRQFAALVERLKSELALRPDQAKAVDGFAKAFQDAVRAGGNDPDSRREVGRRERQKFNQAVEELLSAEQAEKFRVLRAQGQAQRRAPPVGGGVAGRVFVLDAKGNPQAVSIRTGATDGASTEVLSGSLKAGDVVITGTTGANRATSRPTSGGGLRMGF